jgi:hypothetical protein
MSKISDLKKFFIGFPMVVLLVVAILVLTSPSYNDIAVAGKPDTKHNNGKSGKTNNSQSNDSQPSTDGQPSNSNDGQPSNSDDTSNSPSNKGGSSNKGNKDGIRGNSPSVPDSDNHGMNRGLPGPDKSYDQDNGCGNELGLKEDDNNGWCGNKPTKTPRPTETPPTPTPPTPTPPTPPTPTESPTPTPTPPTPPPSAHTPITSQAEIAQPCLPEEVIVAKKASTITVFVLKDTIPTLEYYLDLPVAGSSENDIISVSPDGCWVYYSWQNAGADQTDIYRIAIDGKRIVQVTNTEDTSETEPFIANNWYLYMTSAKGSQVQVEGFIESAGKRWVVASAGQTPSASPDGQLVTYQDIASGKIAAAFSNGTSRDFLTYNLTGSWNAWRPDGSGMIYQEEQVFYTLPFTGNQAAFVQDARSAALRPAGGYAVVLSLDNNLSMYELKDWLITGDPIEIKPLIQTSFVTWWTPWRLPYIPQATP